MRYTQEQYERACAADLAGYLAAKGYEMKRSGSEMELLNPRGVTVRGSGWFDHYAGEGGGSIQFLVKYGGLRWPEAVLALAGDHAQESAQSLGEDTRAPCARSPSLLLSSTPPPKEKKPFALPAAAPDNRRVFAYLTQTRGIDPQIVQTCLENGIVYESREVSVKSGDAHHNCVFVGRDEEGVARSATIRGMYSAETTPFRHDVQGSDKSIPFRIERAEPSRAVYVYESAIDLLSHDSMRKAEATGNKNTPNDGQNAHRLALGGLHDGGLEWFLHRHPEVERITFCLDRDDAGMNGAAALIRKYAERGYDTDCLLPEHKDWNEDLVRGHHDSQDTPPYREPWNNQNDDWEVGG